MAFEIEQYWATLGRLTMFIVDYPKRLCQHNFNPDSQEPKVEDGRNMSLF